MTSEQAASAIAHTRVFKERIEGLIGDLRTDIRELDEPQAKALLETTAEALGGLVRAFEDYEKKEEAAWD